MLLTIIGLLGSILPVVLKSIPALGGIGTLAGTLLTNLLGPITTLINNLKAGQSKTQDGLAALAAMAGVIAVLESTTNLPAGVLLEVQNIDKDVQAALVAYATAEKGLDLTVYAPIAPVV